MKVIKKTGLVPLIFQQSSGAHNAGEIAGYPPDRVYALLAARANGKPLAVLADIPYGIETFDVADPPESEDEDGAEGKAKEGAAKAEEVEIPSDWESTHNLAKIALAKKVKGLPKTEKVSVTDAEKIIRGELAKRAAA